MRVSYQTFNRVAIVLGILAVALLPFWRLGQWGYAPSVVTIVLLVSMFVLRALARD